MIAAATGDRISRAELERRWDAARTAMRVAGIDVLVMRDAHDWLGGYVKWFTDVPATNGYARVVVFHLTEPMTVVQQGKNGVRIPVAADDRQNPGVGEIAFSAAYSSIHFTNAYEPGLACDAIEHLGAKTIGLVGMGSQPHAFVATIEERFRGRATLVDATDAIDLLKARKSPEELAMLRVTATMQDEIFAVLLERIRPGMVERELTAIAQYEGQMRGSEQGIFMIGSGPAGTRAGFRPRHFQTRVLERGDVVTLLIENNGPGGFYTEFGRTIVLGKATAMLRDSIALACELREQTIAALRPGALPADIFRAHNAAMSARALPPELRLYSHGQGYDMVERPLLRDDETMPIEAGMCLSCHPTFETESTFATMCDNYIVADEGPAQRIHATEEIVFER